MASKSVEAIFQSLPQTQCGDCSYAGCKPYAEAIVNQGEALNRCLPGGTKVLKTLGQLMNQNIEALIPEMEAKTKFPATAFIREAECIGCTKCISACPVDAILGSAKLMHTVIGEECTGCGLCVEPCPMDCIDLKPLESVVYNKAKALDRYTKRQEREATIKNEKIKIDLQEKTAPQDFIAAALERAKAKKKI